jgi:hypothetical protein
MRAMAEKRGVTLPTLIKPLATPYYAGKAASGVGARIGEYLVEGAKNAGLVDENELEQYRKKLADALPDWAIVGKPEGVETINPTGQRELVVRPRVEAPNLGRSLAEYQATARQQEDTLRRAQAVYDASDADLRSAMANPATPDIDLRDFERDMRQKLQRVVDLRQSMRGMGYTEEEIKAVK